MPLVRSPSGRALLENVDETTVTTEDGGAENAGMKSEKAHKATGKKKGEKKAREKNKIQGFRS